MAMGIWALPLEFKFRIFIACNLIANTVHNFELEKTLHIELCIQFNSIFFLQRNKKTIDHVRPKPDLFTGP